MFFFLQKIVEEEINMWNKITTEYLYLIGLEYEDLKEVLAPYLKPEK